MLFFNSEQSITKAWIKEVINGTGSLFLCDAHDLHGLHSFFKHLVILLTWDLDVARAQETVISEGLQKKLL